MNRRGPHLQLGFSCRYPDQGEKEHVSKPRLDKQPNILSELEFFKSLTDVREIKISSSSAKLKFSTRAGTSANLRLASTENSASGRTRLFNALRARLRVLSFWMEKPSECKGSADPTDYTVDNRYVTTSVSNLKRRILHIKVGWYRMVSQLLNTDHDGYRIMTYSRLPD